MFDTATKMKLRFETNEIGLITTEDLWDMPLANSNGPSLDKIARILAKQIKEEGEESFINESTKSNAILEMKLDIVKHVIKDKLEAKADQENVAERKLRKEKLLSLLASKQDEKLNDLGIDEIESMIADL